MTPLDYGSTSDVYRSPVWDGDRTTISISDAATLGEGLRAARLALGRSLEDLSDATRVRRQYLVAIEEGAYDRLPHRPFSTGYVRAYARALGVDEETAADRFKAESPNHTEDLKSPVGSELDDVKPSHTPWVLGATVLIAAVVLWNVAQHAISSQKHTGGDLAQSHESGWRVGAVPGFGTDDNFIRIGAPQPAPKDQTVPAPYVTPGLEAQLAPTSEGVQAPSGPVIPVGAAFNPKGAIYGAAPNESSVILQATKPAAVVLRSPDGSIYFARQLAAGEAYRAPLAAGNAVVDVSDPASFGVYLNGEFHGGLGAAVTPLQQLNTQAAQLAAAAQARQQAAAQPTAAATVTASAPPPASDAASPG